MKAKHVFTTLGLALTMGLGVAAGLSHVREFKQAKAGDSVTLYFDVTATDWWNNNSAETYAHCFGGSVADTTWPGKKMSLVEGKTTKYSVEIDSTYTKVIFTRVNPADHTTVWNRTSKEGGTAISLPSDYSVSNQWNLTADGSNYDDGNYCGNWSHYAPPAAKYAVDVYVDGVKRGTEQIGEGELPENPAGQYGKRFSGWFDNSECTEGHEVTEITSATTVYGKMITLPTVTYILDQSKGEVGKFAKTNLYAYDAGGHNADWPGVEITGVPKSFTVPNDATLVINAGQDLEQTVDITQSGVANDTLYLLDTVDGEGKYEVQWKSEIPVPDEPEKEDTYYLVGTETNWKYEGATELSTTSIYKTNNTAVLFNYSAKANEEIKVRGVFGGEDKWYGVGGEGGTNYVFAAAGEYDIYLNANKEVYVASCAIRHTIVTTCYKYAGKASEGSFVISQYGYEGSAFSPWVYADGYVCTGIYTSHPSNTKYVPEDLAGKAATVYFYADFMKVGTYLVGNEKFAGTGLAWNIKGGQLMTVPASGNKFEAVISITGASPENPVLVKGVDYHADEPLDSHYLTWTIASSTAEYTAPTSVSQDGDGNFVFTENTTFAMYVNQEDMVYFNVGFDAFNTMFLNEIGGVCESDGSTNPTLLAAAWEKVKAAYNNLTTADKEKYNPGKTIDSGDESGTDQEKVIAKYKYIVVTKYAGVYEDFIWNHDYSSNRISIAQTSANNTALVVILVSAVAVISAAGLFLVIRRRKHN